MIAECPQCQARIVPHVQLVDGRQEPLPSRCGACGWREGDALLTLREAQARLLQAAEELGGYVHASTDPPLPVPAIHLSPAERLRRDATRMEARDATIVGLRRAVRIVRALQGDVG